MNSNRKITPNLSAPRRAGLATTPRVLGALALGILILYFGLNFRSHAPTSMAGLLALPPAQLANVPIARMNLLCANGLDPTSELDLEQCLGTIDAWSKRVRSETARHEYRFREHPDQFENSFGYFRMLMLAVVLAEDFSVHYSPERKMQPTESQADDGFFANPADVFLHGLLGSQRQGTCSSMPVLYVAVGRQLGYPLKLVTTKGHMFVRWDGDGERFNIEATSHGLSRFDDDYYRRWPFEITPAEEAEEGYLKSLTPAEELAVFLSIRGMCVREAHRYGEAAQSFAEAAGLAPECRSYGLLTKKKRREGNRLASLPNSQANQTKQ